MPSVAKRDSYTIDLAAELALEAIELAEQVADAALEKGTDLGGFSALVLARACQSMGSSVVLARQGFNGDAMSVGRTLTELTIDYGYIVLAPERRLKLFTEFQHIPNYEMAREINELHGGTVPAETMRILKDRHDAAQQNNPNPKQRYTTWSGLSVKKRAVKAKRQRMYSLPYADACTASHSGYGTLEYALVDRHKNPRIHFGPMPSDLKAIDLAFAALTVLIADVIRACKLPKALDHEREAPARHTQALLARRGEGDRDGRHGALGGTGSKLQTTKLCSKHGWSLANTFPTSMATLGRA